jgi:hypothetical protein
MAIINSYPIGVPKTNDLLVGTSMPSVNTDADPITKNFPISSVIALASENPKVYVAELNNMGAGAVAPVATVIKNTIGDIVWTRTGVGSYVGTLTGAFTEDKTFLSGQGYSVSTLVGGTGSWPNAQSLNSNNADTVSVYNYALNLTAGDNLADNVGMFIEIKVYA